jgi:hypothetical protein
VRWDILTERFDKGSAAKEMLNLNQDASQQVAQEAFDIVSGNRKWEVAIAKAKAQPEANPDLRFDGQSLLILSPSGEIYNADGLCQCKAFEKRQPCWHRAAARLAERYNEMTH